MKKYQLENSCSKYPALKFEAFQIQLIRCRWYQTKMIGGLSSKDRIYPTKKFMKERNLTIGDYYCRTIGDIASRFGASICILDCNSYEDFIKSGYIKEIT